MDIKKKNIISKITINELKSTSRRPRFVYPMYSRDEDIHIEVKGHKKCRIFITVEL